MDSQNDILTANEVAQVLGLSDRAVTRKFVSGSIPAFKVQGQKGQEWRCHREELDKYLAANADGQRRQPDGHSVSLSQTEEQRQLLAAFAQLPDSIERLQQTISEAPHRFAEHLTDAVVSGIQETTRTEQTQHDLEEAEARIKELQQELETERRRTWVDRLLHRKGGRDGSD